MEASVNSQSWEIVPESSWAGWVLGILFVYLFFRHFMFVLMIMDAIIGWLRQFRWFPGKGRRMRTFVHWLIALGLFIGFLVAGKLNGFLTFVPN